jgi:hypothetical protein
VNTSKPKHRLLFLQQRTNQRGFSLPTATGFGLIILIVGQTLILRSFNDRVASLGQVASNEAVAVAEIGLTRYQAFLNRNRQLALLCASVNNPPDPSKPAGQCTKPERWEDAATALDSKVCPASSKALQAERLQALAAQDTTNWQDIDPNDPSQGQFRLVRYIVVDDPPNPPNPATAKGYLTVEGRVRQTGAGNTATARLQVTIPLTPSQLGQPSLYPGVWLQTLPTSSNTYFASSANVSGSNPTNAPEIALDVQANVFISDCAADLRAVRANPTSNPITNYAVVQTDIAMPELPPLPTIVMSPTGTQSPGSPSPTGDNLQANLDLAGNDSPPTGPQPPKAYGLGTIKTDLALPQPLDSEDLEGLEGQEQIQVYRYLVEDITRLAQLTIDSSPKWNKDRKQTLPVRVELYVRGDLITGSKIEHTCTSINNIPCEPTNLRIYAYKYATEKPQDVDYPHFCLEGESNQPLKAMIFAPGYRIGTNGSARFEGTLWARAWETSMCRADSNQIMLSQSGSWGSQKVTLPPQLGAVQQWQRQQVSQEVDP